MNNKQSWIDQRFPLSKVINEHLAEYYTPRNFNFLVFLWWLSSSDAFNAAGYWDILNHAL